MVGHLSYKQFTQVRFLQLRSCFSGATEAQLFRNQPAVGSNPTGSFHMQVSRNWQRTALPGRIYGFDLRSAPVGAEQAPLAPSAPLLAFVRVV